MLNGPLKTYTSEVENIDKRPGKHRIVFQSFVKLNYVIRRRDKDAYKKRF